MVNLNDPKSLEAVNLNDPESLKQAYQELLSNSSFFKPYKNLRKDFKKLSKDHKELEKAIDAKPYSSLEDPLKCTMLS